MKKVIKFSLLLLLLSITLYSQNTILRNSYVFNNANNCITNVSDLTVSSTYKQQKGYIFNDKDGFYVDGMTWITGYFMFDAKDVVGKVYPVYYTYVIEGDTVIGDIKYKKMNQYYRSIYSTGTMYYDTFFARYENGRYMFNLPDYKDWTYYSLWIGDDVVFFDENLKSGDNHFGNEYEKIAYIGDTLFNDSSDEIRRYWKLLPYSSSSSLYTEAVDNVLWVEGIGSISQPIPYFIDEVDCACYEMLLYCINSEGDTIYRNKKYIDLVAPYFKTNMKPLTAGDISIKQADGECIVTLPTATKWSATLYGSNGAIVASKAGEGSEIILPAESKGTHILVLNIDGKEYTKKVVIK